MLNKGKFFTTQRLKRLRYIGRTLQRFKTSDERPENDMKPLNPYKTKIEAFMALGRYHRQTGTYLLFIPCVYGVLIGCPTPLNPFLGKNI